MTEKLTKRCTNGDTCCHPNGPILPVSEFHLCKSNRDGLQRYCKQCRKSKYRDNREQEMMRVKQWQERNPDKTRAYKAKWWETNPDYWSAYYQEHSDTIKRRSARWFIEHHEYVKNRNKKWRQNHKEVCKMHTSRRRARLRGAEGSHTAEDIRQQLKRQKNRCHYCGVELSQTYHVDHVVPLSRGGSNWPSNLVIACTDCNQSKYNKLPHEWSKGGRLL